MSGVEMHVKIDDTSLREALKLAPEQFATANRNSVNDTLRDVQTAERDVIGKVFHVTQKTYIRNTVKIEKGGFATKEVLRGEIGIDQERNVLAKHEEGGDFGSYKGNPKVPIPSHDIRRSSYYGGSVSRGNRLLNFLPFALAPTQNQARFTGSVSLGIFGRRATARSHTAPLLVGQRGSFFIKTRQGDPFLVRRQGRGRGRKLTGLYVWYAKKRIRPQLKFYETAMQVIPKAWAKNAELAVHHAMKRAKLL